MDLVLLINKGGKIRITQLLRGCDEEKDFFIDWDGRVIVTNPRLVRIHYHRY